MAISPLQLWSISSSKIRAALNAHVEVLSISKPVNANAALTATVDAIINGWVFLIACASAKSSKAAILVHILTRRPATAKLFQFYVIKTNNGIKNDQYVSANSL